MDGCKSPGEILLPEASLEECGFFCFRQDPEEGFQRLVLFLIAKLSRRIPPLLSKLDFFPQTHPTNAQLTAAHNSQWMSSKFELRKD